MVSAGYRVIRRTIKLCPHCGWIEFMVEAGWLFWRCTECYQLVAKEIE